MEGSEIVKDLIVKLQTNEPTTSMPVIVVRALVQFTEQSRAKTFAEYSQKLQEATAILKQDLRYFAGIDLFTKLLSTLDNVDQFKKSISKNVQDFELEYKRNLKKCIFYGLNFVSNDQTILLHSYSKLVMSFLVEASLKSNLKVVISIDKIPLEMESDLLSNNIPFCLIKDSQIGIVMEEVDFVLVGALGVTRNGGILNDVGTLPMAIIAKHFSKPFYCIAESYKFMDLYPLSSSDLLLQELEFDANQLGETRDYTPPEFVTMIFSNEGLLTPTGVAELFLKAKQ